MIKSFNDSMARQPDRRRARNEDTYIFSSGYENRKRFQTYPNDVMSPEEQARAGARIYRKPESPKTALLKTQGIEVEEFSSLDDFLANGDVSGQKGKIKRDSSQ